ncbi:hypothetical protein [Nocardia blacklockiae]|uniref:hypothetical protein n=1 Tax=Nocardia blacklockiae TaxID=480036 RepID=UPI001895EF11|nr:hypothetical protein [Nocardia blacklockiae]MBF6174833.1 hypothetical protein [Nocardia blacklockiae]
MDSHDDEFDRFAAVVLRQVGDLGDPHAQYDPAEFAIQLSDDTHMYLANLFRDTRGLPDSERDDAILRFVTAVRDSSGELPGWPAARKQLRPILRPVTFGLDAPPDLRPVSRPAFPFVHELVAYDQPASRSIILEATLREWGITSDELFAAAHRNLAEIVPATTEPGTFIRYVDDGDGYVASWPLLSGWLATHRTPERRPVAFMPDYDTLIVAPDDPEILGQVFDMVEEHYGEATRPLSPQGYTLDEHDRVVPFDRAGPHPQLPAAARARCGLAVTEYGLQTHWLNETYERDFDYGPYDLDPAYVGALSYVESDDGPCTVAVWGKGVEWLLPEADYLSVYGVDHRDEPVHLFEIPFADAAEIAGLTPVPDMAPPRYEARSWPTEEVMNKLRALAVGL